ncbi:hypothetical protein CFP56_003972 [Quercus suber]|uniref:Uncharacterized protein n=1 Tax=Quercus suber TaxID=58331 RepID=A0AAW0LBP3_QUESU
MVTGGIFERSRVYVELFNELGINSSFHPVSKASTNSTLNNPWSTIDYYCNFQWLDNFHWFDIYLFDRDHPQCSNCIGRLSLLGV